MLDLKDILKGKVVILCLGNIERGDDGAGPCLARAIKGRISYGTGKNKILSCTVGDGSEGVQAPLPRGDSEAEVSAERHRGGAPMDKKIPSRRYSEKNEEFSCEVINAGVTPENYTGVIKTLKPDTIIIVDSIYFEGRAGEIRLFSGEELRSGKISTHDVSPKLLIEYLKSSINAEIYVLGIKPKSNKPGEGLSKEVDEAVRKAEGLFLTK